MHLDLFSRGLLCALAERRRSFVACGPVFHGAFRAMLEAAVVQQLPVPAAAWLENYDPVFGVSPEASEMLLQGHGDFVLTLGRNMAYFGIDAQEAARELGHLPHVDVFRALAAVFDEKLPPSLST